MSDPLNMKRRAHWDNVYRTKAPDAVSWVQADPKTSLKLISESGLSASTWIIDVGGGDSRLVDRLVDLGLTCLTVLDISQVALERARMRLGDRQTAVRWVEADVTADWPAPEVDVWHDRAVFHFLTAEEDRRQYVARLTQALRPNGTAVIAAFALDGPEKCSGLPVVRYSGQSLQEALGSDFLLQDFVLEQHRTPFGTTQSFGYSRFRRNPR